MNVFGIRGIVGSFVVFAGVTLLGGPARAAEPAKPGDRVSIDFTCRAKNGEITATTYDKVALDTTLRKSSVFVPRNSKDPIIVEAGKDCPSCGRPEERGYEGAIKANLAKELVGMKPGQSRSIALGDEGTGGGKEDTRIRLSRYRPRPKEMRMTPESYLARVGKEAKAGDDFTLDPLVPGNVVSVTDQEVVIKFTPRVGEKVETGFGKGVIREAERHYEIVVEPEKDALVRSGAMVGRIVEVDERTFVVDFGHPFGGEKLKCEVTVNSVEPKPDVRASEAGTSVSRKQ